MSKINLNSTYGKAKGVVRNYIGNLSGSKVRRASQHLYSTLDDQAAYFSAGGGKGLKRQLHKKYNKAPLGTGDVYTHDIFGVSKAHKELQGALKARKVTRLATGGVLATGTGGIALHNSLKKTAALNRATIGAGLNKAKEGVRGFGKSVTGSTYRKATNLATKLDDQVTARAGAGMFDDALINTMDRRNRVLRTADKAHSNMWRDRAILGTGVVGTGTLVAGKARKGKVMPQEEKTASLQKVAIPWAAVGKAISRTAGKAWANPLARRALTGAAIGGGGNVVFGPSNQSVGRRFLTGATIGAAGGAAYHGATTRLGMPTATAMGNKARAYGGRQWGKIKNYFGSPATAPKSTPVSVRPKATRYGSGIYATGPQANLARRTNLREINFANKYNAARGTTNKLNVPKVKVQPAPKVAPTPPPAPAMPRETVPDFLKNNYGSTVTP